MKALEAMHMDAWTTRWSDEEHHLERLRWTAALWLALAIAAALAALLGG